MNTPATPSPLTPTQEAYAQLEQAYDLFNLRLFGGKLPPVLLTLQREKHCYGYFSKDRFINRRNKSLIAEIAMNPAYFGVVPLVEILATIAHEQAHCYQYLYGTPGRRRYHNAEWADLMESIGLMPSDTGKPGGRRTGEKMADYPIEGGRFLAACDELRAAGFEISWLDRYPPPHIVAEVLGHGGGTGALAAEQGAELGVELHGGARPKATRTKFTCPKCRAAAWGKSTLQLVCEPCGTKLAAAA